MILLLLFAFLSGLVTIFAPCIWPILPIVLSSSATGGKRKPLGVTLGIVVSFGVLTLTLSYIVSIVPIDLDIFRLIAVFVIAFLGATLLIPSLSKIVEGGVSRLSGRLGGLTRQKGDGFTAGFLTGCALGVVWTPCAGPILATIATLSATQSVNFQIILVTISYMIGVGIPLFLFALLGSRIFARSRAFSRYTGQVQKLFGLIMIATAVLIFTNQDKALQAKLLDAFPQYSQFLIKLENNDLVKSELDKIRKSPSTVDVGEPMPPTWQTLPNMGRAPEFVGITNWLNSDPLTMQSLRGKVVLVDFWTYTCINCIRTLPHIVGWYEKYKDKGFVVIGVHTPEFEFEKKTDNVQQAIWDYKITYPVAQDNDYVTWRAYDNHYWPAKYLIDAKGNVRYTHFGEGEYEQTEENIQELLAEAGKTPDSTMLNLNDSTPRTRNTPETYLGAARMERFASVEPIQGGVQAFTSSAGLPDHYVAYEGVWNVQDEYAAPARGGAALDLHFIASKVFLVITPKKGDVIRVKLDGVPVTAEEAGVDVKNGVVQIDTPRLYELIDLKEVGDRVLRLEFEGEDTQVFAFTFG